MIPLVDLKAQYAAIKPDIQAAINSVLDNTQFINGPEVSRFESAFAEFCHAEHAVGVGNGTDALTLVLEALGIGSGDEVITTVNTFIATAEAIVSVGATPVFVDVDPQHFNMTADRLRAAITSRTRAAIPVHLYGQPAPMREIMQVARGRSINVIEDSAQAHGAEYGGRRVGTWGDAATFSFYPAKNLGAYGDAGAVVTNDGEIARTVRMMKDHGRAEKYVHDFVGVNSRLDTLQAAILGVKLGHMEEWNEARRSAASRYDEALSGLSWLTLPAEIPGGRHVYHLYVVQSDRRDELMKHLAREGVGTGIHYPVPLHVQPAFAPLGYRRGDFPVAERLADSILSIPMYPEIDDELLSRVVQAIGSFGGELNIRVTFM